MAAPAAALAAKAALAIVSDKRLRTLTLSIIVGVVVFFFVIIGTMFSIISGGQESNKSALGYIFNTNAVDISMWDIPSEYAQELESAKARVQAAMDAIESVNAEIQSDGIDVLKAGAIYLCISPEGEITDYSGFAWCFAEKSTSIEEIDGEEILQETVIAIADMSVVYTNIQTKFGIQVTTEQIQNINQTYTFLTTGGIFMGDGAYTGPPGEAYNDATFAQLMAEATKYIGFPYVWGGSTPQTSFDCSGFVCYVYTASGVYNLPRTTAWGIFQQCTVIPQSEMKPGDLVFFTGTYNCPTPTSHIGIYVGEGKFLHCGSPIGYASLSSPYWSSHWYAAGRLN